MGSFTLTEVAARTDVLTVSCSRCDRAERYPLIILIKRHGRSFPIPMLLHELSKGCLQNDLCGLSCPELPALFIEKPLLPEEPSGPWISVAHP
jgi:hypothetical protein